MKYLIPIVTLSFMSCKQDTPPSSLDLTQQVRAFVEHTQSNVTGCDVQGILHPGRPDCNLDDYSAGPGGFGCLSGDEQACRTMALTIAEDGKPYRSYKNRIEGDSENEYSRDQLYGFVAYLVKTKDIENAGRLLNYIKRTGRLCDNPDDNRCDLTPAAWGLLSKTWRYLDLPRNSSMIVNDAVDDTVVLTQVQTVEIGYQLGLQVEFVFLAKQMGLDTALLRSAARIAWDRQPKNPFYCYTVEGTSDTCKKLYLEWFKEGTPSGSRTQWSLARDQEEVQARRDSMGYEALFLGRLLLK